MFAVTEFSRSAQQVVCMLMSAFIVSAALAFGSYAAQAPVDDGYSVTVTQLQ
jgi:hypothetical protein